MEKQFLAIMYNSVAGEVGCALCERVMEADTGLEVFLVGPEMITGHGVVCQNCAEKHDPVLAEQFGCLMSLKQNKEHADKVLPWLFQELETIGVLGTVFKLNEKRDIAYAGGTIAGAVVKMQKELKGFGQRVIPYDPDTDDLPF